ncbi:MAG TPA: alpha-hydroxy acid oxidase, partial [Burkholderiales bacterium]|nr:alpha-hydroxy acid oxidase [Burkholderiales bacterium]
GVEDDVSREANRAAFREWSFVPRVLVNVAKRDLSTELFGRRYALPFGIAPMGICSITGYRGDLSLARAAAAEKALMIFSSSSLIRLEEVFAAAPAQPPWFQAYLPGDVARIEALVERVAKAGYETLVLTVDVPVAANRENNVRAGFSTPLRPSLRLAWEGITHPRWLFGTFLRTLVNHGMPHFENNYAERGAPMFSSQAVRDYSDRGHLTWEHLRLVRRQWKGRLVVKGVLSVEDARLARDEGADGLIVSNHGGRQLDTVIAPLRVLPEIVAAVPGLTVMLDSGVRRGTDVLKALALGAKYVFVGRPMNYASALGGEAGVRRALQLLTAEVSVDMAMLGITSLGQLSSACLRKA